jgi:hypothetical protein
LTPQPVPGFGHEPQLRAKKGHFERYFGHSRPVEIAVEKLIRRFASQSEIGQ